MYFEMTYFIPEMICQFRDGVNFGYSKVWRFALVQNPVLGHGQGYGKHWPERPLSFQEAPWLHACWWIAISPHSVPCICLGWEQWRKITAVVMLEVVSQSKLHWCSTFWGHESATCGKQVRIYDIGYANHVSIFEAACEPTWFLRTGTWYMYVGPKRSSLMNIF